MRTVNTALCLAIVITFGCAVVHRNATAEEGESRARVTGIGGVFFRSRDPKALEKWYREP